MARNAPQPGYMLMTLAKDIIAALDLAPHPEGGWYRQTWESDTPKGQRASGTAIYYLLEDTQISRWHHVDAVEIWHYYAGAPLTLSLSNDELGPATDHQLGPDIAAGQLPQIIVPKRQWQSARTKGDWTLVGCTVSPGFQFDGFFLADKGFDIPR